MTSSSVRRLWTLVVAACAGCGIAAPEIDTAGRCNLGTVPLLIEKGVTVRGSPASVCQAYASILTDYRDTFVDWWGPVALHEEDWTVRVRAGAAVDAAGHTGITYHYSRVVDVAEGALETFPHELRHVQLGRGSDDHHGWCSNFAPWEEEVLGVNERDYLGCQL
ncbi:MAG TPA: hypothetical protein VFN45_12825 [Myxococcaceae bacterium]|nr:hypothetical protein [Myxococcaceae bacterium]